MRNLVAIFIALLPSLSLAIVDCKMKMKSRNKYIRLYNGDRSLLVLPPKSQRYLLGLMVETAPDKYAMALGNYYLSHHEVLYSSLIRRHPGAKIRWAGELKLRNRREVPSLGVIQSTLNASGFVWRHMQNSNSGDANDPQILENVLSRKFSYLVDSSTLHLSFSRQYAHLDPFFRFLEFLELPLNGQEDSIRHVFRDVLEPVTYFFGMVVGGDMGGERAWISQVDAKRIEQYVAIFVYTLHSLYFSLAEDYAEKLVEFLRDFEKRDPRDPMMVELADHYFEMMDRLDKEAESDPEIIDL